MGKAATAAAEWFSVATLEVERDSEGFMPDSLQIDINPVTEMVRIQLCYALSERGQLKLREFTYDPKSPSCVRVLEREPAGVIEYVEFTKGTPTVAITESVQRLLAPSLRSMMWEADMGSSRMRGYTATLTALRLAYLIALPWKEAAKKVLEGYR